MQRSTEKNSLSATKFCETKYLALLVIQSMMNVSKDSDRKSRNTTTHIKTEFIFEINN